MTENQKESLPPRKINFDFLPQDGWVHPSTKEHPENALEVEILEATLNHDMWLTHLNEGWHNGK